ncbi:hypothetical protein JYT74_02025 [Crocinitomix catalasitica]|nr:hypothetical protein [Crocinitomix catalasitica]
MKKFVYLSVALLSLAACRKSQFGAVERSSGDADFTHYVAVGNSLTQGFQDNGLYEEGQEQSYPSIIAKQMMVVESNMEDFDQPEVFGNGSGYMHLEYINNEIEVISPGDPGGYEAEGWDTWGPVLNDYYENLGISGMTLLQAVGLDDPDIAVNNIILGGATIDLFPLPLIEIPGNPFARFLDFGGNSYVPGSTEPTIQYTDHIRGSGATFFTNWLGNNDILGYAASGGVVQSIDGSPLGLGVIELNAISDPAEFKQKYDSVLTAFNDIGAKGICATIPDVTAIPFFNTFTPTSIKEDYGFTEVWIEDYTGTPRLAIDADLILLTAKDTIEAGTGGSATDYLPNDMVLDSYEVGQCQSGVSQLNSMIRASANQFDFAVVDMYTFVNTIKGGAVFDGVDVSADYISGGGFSLDGIHLNPRGYAIIANQFIKEINNHYGSNIPRVAIANYRGIVFP